MSKGPGPRPTEDARSSRETDRTSRATTILAGAAVAFAARGYSATSVREVAHATGASLSSIYHHFGSKEGLLAAIMVGNFKSVQTDLEERLRDVEDAERAIELFVINHVAFFSLHRDEMKVMSHELDTLDGEAGKEVKALRNAYTARARGFLGTLRPGLSADELEVSTLCFFGMLNWTYRWFHTVAEDTSAEELGQRMARLFLDGFARSEAWPAQGMKTRGEKP